MGLAKTYIPVIGLEVHAELNTRTKMFCDCLNDPMNSQANLNICPVCVGHPGTLPVINREAIESMIKIGMAVIGEIPAVSKFDRKHYLYPDLPKGYQISQYDIPFVFGGKLKGVNLTRIHLEEDAGKLSHGEDGSSLVDYNRAGLPLMELVTEPDIREVEKIGEFGRELQLLLRYLNVSDADMEKGQMRVEVNLSLGTIVDGELVFGTKVEVKNINSFKAAMAAAEYEIQRQKELLEMGEAVIQETRGWDENKRRTFSQRIKEEANDYRYFPDPDLPAVDLSQFDFKKLRSEIPELPNEKRVRLEKEYGVKGDNLELLVFERDFANYFEAVVSELRADIKEDTARYESLALNYLLSDLKGLMIADKVSDLSKVRVTPENFADLVILIGSEKVNSRVGKDILKKMYDTGLDPNVILSEEGLEQVSDTAELSKLANQIIIENPEAVKGYKGGNDKILMFFVGKAMGALKGKGNPKILHEIFTKLLSET
ncbi:MAG: Asp-tRNA(Asn)/Glu-tRNA(Gln) amidotransferase subunit GatB [Candidatus Harrisonbacteria bacterium CG10_big_fil_rev_8_21_14_0_10_38_8]|uniref:Aspartyl/glutamyl-tRNA(Asn/Gln) amidotransferase subunit B n=1 Tax=Candidatus Harrisonbacteria bacterium CG10_big_fil_rev_8_21_14_0_10_38_8 TaxID=1974582 RepID=A0A2M6WJI7_9BACT|nr:MAG: Asp-tRNA(Asn)/Glu-tRNA(Gln) amidotransferase subunit GatB [Candidatus Harrisonbacteria bacterium CG10_big_fil_rev_8_21_14_0_10_38_8]